MEAGEIRCPEVVGNECMIEGGSGSDRDFWTRDPLGCVYGETRFHEMAIKHDEGNKTTVKVWRDLCSDRSCRFVLFATSSRNYYYCAIGRAVLNPIINPGYNKKKLRTLCEHRFSSNFAHEGNPKTERYERLRKHF